MHEELRKPTGAGEPHFQGLQVGLSGVGVGRPLGRLAATPPGVKRGLLSYLLWPSTHPQHLGLTRGGDLGGEPRAGCFEEAMITVIVSGLSTPGGRFMKNPDSRAKLMETSTV